MLNVWVLPAYLQQSLRTAILAGAGWLEEGSIHSLHTFWSESLAIIEKKEKQQTVVSEIIREERVSFLNSIVPLWSC